MLNIVIKVLRDTVGIIGSRVERKHMRALHINIVSCHISVSEVYFLVSMIIIYFDIKVIDVLQNMLRIPSLIYLSFLDIQCH